MKIPKNSPSIHLRIKKVMLHVQVDRAFVTRYYCKHGSHLRISSHLSKLSSSPARCNVSTSYRPIILSDKTKWILIFIILLAPSLREYPVKMREDFLNGLLHTSSGHMNIFSPYFSFDFYASHNSVCIYEFTWSSQTKQKNNIVTFCTFLRFCIDTP